MIYWKLIEGEGRKVVYVQYKDRAENIPEPSKANVTFRRRAK